MRFVLSMLLACCATYAGAQTLGPRVPDEKYLLAKSLVELMGTVEVQEQTQKICREAAPDASIDPVKIQVANPAAFSGVTPKSAYWPQVKSAYEAYRQQVCDALPAGELVAMMAQAYADNASVETLKATTAFYASPAGREFSTAARAVLAVEAQRMMQRTQEGSQEPARKLQAQLRKIGAAYKAAPK